MIRENGAENVAVVGEAGLVAQVKIPKPVAEQAA
jgi:hypothetical protein